MKSKDVIYVSNSDATEILKFLELVRSGPDTANAFVTPWNTITN